DYYCYSTDSSGFHKF
nr:immunoglobulin light chain junction region [Macaca mulatta]MOX12557.1 immunoglobulin light chain junction region [Macaca mulatta]MOX12682.1 immunoglobulin light chain junction region [Macaca mulatta]MOX13242.1 immunoglobulin light chain junction region [Macaca mulatta]MOX13254.1 immunoglobulin light chain junction region [Macaca mulatta]